MGWRSIVGDQVRALAAEVLGVVLDQVGQGLHHGELRAFHALCAVHGFVDLVLRALADFLLAVLGNHHDRPRVGGLETQHEVQQDVGLTVPGDRAKFGNRVDD